MKSIWSVLVRWANTSMEQRQCIFSIILPMTFLWCWCLRTVAVDNLPQGFNWLKSSDCKIPQHVSHITFILVRPFSDSRSPVCKHLYSFFSAIELYNIKHVLPQAADQSKDSIRLFGGLWPKHVVNCSILHMHEFRALRWRMWFAVMYCDIPIHYISRQ